MMANNEEGNDSCMYNAKSLFCTDGALAQPKSSITSINNVKTYEYRLIVNYPENRNELVYSG